MNHEAFYVAAATVIPLLLIAVMATRSLAPGELHPQRVSTLWIFGLPVLGEVATFAFLFFQPVPFGVGLCLAIATWAGLLSQLIVAVWWTLELVRPRPPLLRIGADQEGEAKLSATTRCPECFGSGLFSGPDGPSRCLFCSGQGRTPDRG